MYTLRFPFSVPPDHEIGVTEMSGELDDLRFSLIKQEPFYILTITGFATDQAATSFVSNVWAGLMWVMLQLGLPSDLLLEPATLAYTEDPEQAAKNLGFADPIDAFTDGDRPAVYPTGKRIRVVTAGAVKLRISRSADELLKVFRNGASFAHSDRVIVDDKLRIALELYRAYFTEVSANAKFLSLITSLEALATGVQRTQLVMDLLGKWRKEAEELQETLPEESEDAFSLEAVTRELLIRRDDSIRRQVRRLVITTLQLNGDADATATARRAVELYDLRSRLVHDGKVAQDALSPAISEALSIVKRVLMVRFTQNAQ